MTFTDKTVLVTGANRGIGQALTAEALSQDAKQVYAGTRGPLAHPDSRRHSPDAWTSPTRQQVRAAAGERRSAGRPDQQRRHRAARTT